MTLDNSAGVMRRVTCIIASSSRFRAALGRIAKRPRETHRITLYSLDDDAPIAVDGVRIRDVLEYEDAWNDLCDAIRSRVTDPRMTFRLTVVRVIDKAEMIIEWFPAVTDAQRELADA